MFTNVIIYKKNEKFIVLIRNNAKRFNRMSIVGGIIHNNGII